MRFSYRRYQEGDAAAINELYFRITGRQRTIQEHAWQWLQSPAGESEMWLIEVENDGGKKELIGHHGVMAEIFTYRGKIARVGKTENTMVMPEYQEKILYPRYEKLFLNQYENCFHALFSTTGPVSAIRLRKAMGYEFDHEWTPVYVGHEPYLSLSFAQERFFKKNINHSQKLANLNGQKINDVEINCIDEQHDNFDFDQFWYQASPNYGLTPARTRANLQWRFWSNPYNVHHTLILNSPNHGEAVAIISFRSGYILQIDDLYCTYPKDLNFYLLIMRQWAKKFLLINVIKTTTTSDCAQLFKNPIVKNTTLLHALFKSDGQIEKAKMPRKITAMGRDLGMSKDEAWYVTPFYFEGRS
jgi:hypothetical protein